MFPILEKIPISQIIVCYFSIIAVVPHAGFSPGKISNPTYHSTHHACYLQQECARYASRGSSSLQGRLHRFLGPFPELLSQTRLSLRRWFCLGINILPDLSQTAPGNHYEDVSRPVSVQYLITRICVFSNGERIGRGFMVYIYIYGGEGGFLF